jgi:DNA primase
VEGSLYIKELAERVGVDEAAVQEEVRAMPAGRKDVLGGFHQQTAFKKWDRLEQQIIKMMLQYPQILPEISKQNILDLFSDDGLRSIGKMVLAYKDDSQSRISDIMSSIADDEKRNLISHVSIVEDSWNQKNCLNILARFVLSRRRNEKTLLDKIKAAEEANDVELVQKLLEEKQKRAELSDKQKMALQK